MKLKYAPSLLLALHDKFTTGEAFLRGISIRQVGRVIAIVTGEAVSAQTVSKLTRDLDEAVQQFHQAPLTDDWAYLFLVA